MTTESNLDPTLLLQPVESGALVPAYFPNHGAFLLNLAPVMESEVWDDYGNKELDQSQRLRGLAKCILAIAEEMERLSIELKSYPDADDYSLGNFEQTWDEICEEVDSVLKGGYFEIKCLVDALARTAEDDFME